MKVVKMVQQQNMTTVSISLSHHVHEYLTHESLFTLQNFTAKIFRTWIKFAIAGQNT